MISIIVTAYKEPNLSKCLDSILNQKLPKNYEILVVSPDKETIAIAKKYQKKNKRIKIIKDPGKGKPTALNLAFKHAKGKILVLTDGDVILGKNSIPSLLKHFKDPKVGAVSGQVIYTISKDTLFYEWAKLSGKVFHEQRTQQAKQGTLMHPTGYLYAIRSSIVKSIPENTLSDDAVIGYLIKSKGYTIAYEPKAKVYVKFPTSVSDFIKQKSRTRAGFLQMKNWFGTSVRSMGTEISFGFKELIKAYGFKLHKMILLSLIYLLAWFRAYWLFYRKMPFEKVWQRIESTK